MSWPTVALGDVFQIARGGSPRPIDNYITDDADGVNWVSIRDASNSSKFITKTEKKIRPAGVSKSRMVYPCDFLLTNSMSFGRPYILQTTGCIHDGWLVLSSDKSVVDQDFFYHLLGSEFVYKKFAQLAAGAVVKNLNCDLVKTVQVPLPPLSEQRRIAAILDKADALCAKRRVAIAKLDQLLQSVFLDMFGDPVTNPRGWRKSNLEDICEAIIDCPHSTPNWTDVGIVCLRTSNLLKGGWDWTDKRFVSEQEYRERSKRSEARPGDIILSREGTVGVAAIVDAEMRVCMGQRLVQVRADLRETCPDFLLQLLLYDLAPERIGRLMVGSTAKHLNVKDLRELKVFVPPLALQNGFAKISARLKFEASCMSTSMIRLDALLSGIQHAAFAGATATA